MKTMMNLKGKIALLFIAALSLNSYANTEPAKVNFQENPESILMFDLPENDNTFITIFNSEGTSIFSDRLSPKTKTTKAFDFAGLNQGTYTMVINNKYRTVEKTIDFTDQKVTILDKVHKYRPVFSIDDNLLKVSYLNKTEGNISLTLEDMFYTYFKEKAGTEMAFGKTINIENLSRGEYTLTLMVDEKEYNYTFQK